MLEQPSFGRRLRQLRTAQGISQASLAGDGMSTGYLSRLESGARQPTARVLSYLSERLGVEQSDFEEEDSLAQALSIAASAETDSAIMALDEILASGQEQDAALRWQALWMIARLKRQNGERDQELSRLEELVEIADELDLPELRARSRTQLARCLRARGEITRAHEVAVAAWSIARDSGLSVHDAAGALLALVSVEAEAGRLPDARAHADELLELVKAETGTLPVEALWAAATVRFRQGDHEATQELFEEALALMDSRSGLQLWMRLRFAAASLYLQGTPPCPSAARARLDEAATALELIGTPLHEQEMTTLRAHLALHEGQYKEARALYDSLRDSDLRLTFRDQIRLATLHNRLLVLEGQVEEGINGLKELAQQAHSGANIDLAAEIWRVLAEMLSDVHRTS